MKLFAAMMVFLSLSLTAKAQSVVVDVTLNPMGDFKAKTNDVSGFATLSGDEIKAENIVVKLKSLKTGVELRDKHTQKYLETEKFPEAVLVSAKGKNGKGTGKIKIRGVEKEIAGDYKVSGKKMQAKFKLNLADFNITDINYMGVGVEDEVALIVVVPIK